MSISQSTIANSKCRSWHHRMARLVPDGYRPACVAAGCPKIEGQRRAASYICEWDQQQGGKSVSRRRLFCSEHAGNFALRHNIYLAGLPDVKLSQIETAARDDWRYSDNVHHEGTKTPKQTNSNPSCLGGVVTEKQEES
jgi:hypothetical protein